MTRSITINELRQHQVNDFFIAVKEANDLFLNKGADARGKKVVFAVECKPMFDVGQPGSVMQDDDYTVTVTAGPKHNDCDPDKVYAKLAELLVYKP